MSTVRIDLEAPMSWQALSSGQVRAVARITHGGLLREEQLIALFCELCGVTLSREGEVIMLHRGEEATPIDVLALGDLSSRFGWVLDTEPDDTACPFGSINRYLLDTTFGDYFHADAMLLRFAATGDMECARRAYKDLDCMEERQKRWRESLKDGLVNKEEYESKLKKLRKKYDSMDEVDAWAMQLWWCGVKNGLKVRYPLVFESPDDRGCEGYDPIAARQNIMLMLADGKPQDNEKIEQSNLHDVLSALQHKIEQAKHAEEQLKRR